MATVELIRTPGLGDTSYILAHDGIAVVVDPQRDIDRLLEPLADLEVEVRWILETHLHNDYVSGGRDLRRLTGAELVLPASAAPAFRHTPAFHGEPLGDDRLTIRPLHTPGHTPEHTSYEVSAGGSVLGVFTGGSLLVGSAGRPDLLGPDRTDTLARLQFRSVRRLAELPDETPVYPTHGEGSFCTAGGCGRLTTTIGLERAENPLLAVRDEDAFVEALTGGLGPWPTYYRHMGPINLAGPEPMAGLDLPELDVAALTDPSTTVVDIRPKEAFARGHVPGSIGIELRDDTGVWAGWVLDHDARIVLVADRDQDVTEALRQLRRIGMDATGVVRGVDGWTAEGLPLASHRTVGRADFIEAVDEGKPVLDVRMPSEWADGTIPGSITAFAADIAAGVVPDGLSGEVWVACGSGFRASVAAHWLTAAGIDPVILTEDGVPEVLSELAQRT